MARSSITAPECAIRVERRALLAVAVLAILVATLRPGGTTLPSGWSFDISSGEAALSEAIQNLLLFVPLGVALVLNGVRPLRAIAIGAGLSFSVEFLQQWIPGRDPSVGDIATNTISAGVGVALMRFAPRWLMVSPRRSAWQAIGTALLAVVVWLGTGVLLRPSIPPPPYREVRTPDFSQWGHYRGTVLETNAGPLPLSVVPLPLRITAVAGSRPPGRIAPLVAILDERDTKVLVVAVDGADLALRYHTRAAPLTLEQPDMRWRRAMAGIAPRDTFTVQAWRGEYGNCLSLNSARRCGLGYTIGDGWKLIFYPERWPGWVLGTLNSLWLAGCLMGIGYWGRRAGTGGNRRERAVIVVAVSLALLGMLIVPSVTGLNATSINEWIGAIGGMGLGYGLASAGALRTAHSARL